MYYNRLGGAWNTFKHGMGRLGSPLSPTLKALMSKPVVQAIGATTAWKNVGDGDYAGAAGALVTPAVFGAAEGAGLVWPWAKETILGADMAHALWPFFSPGPSQSTYGEDYYNPGGY